MRIHFQNRNHGYTRPQWLAIIVLALIAFECGFHYAEKRFQEAKAADAKRLAAIKTTPQPYKLERESLFEDETNVVAFQPMRRPQPLPEKTNPIARPPAPSGGGGVVPLILKGDGQITRRKVPFPNDNYLRNTNGQVIGIRIALP